MRARTASVKRATSETDISLTVNLDGHGRPVIDCGIPFMNHMLELLARHSLIDLRLAAKGDLAVDYHHTVEDMGICLGQALDEALGNRKGIARYGCAYIPMDETLCRAVIDLGGRPFLHYELACRKQKIRDFNLGLIEEMLRSFCIHGRLNLHVTQFYGKDPHHAVEAVFKALARALRQAITNDPREQGIPSSKGKI
ncbi:MAG: imidazoleglycerol-phosphate dehydratase HisB [Kiritimatiellia bacterium]|nr:imidazoleglycerol-phosphate dehydratase HisB [Lentisphaerota bacterium]